MVIERTTPSVPDPLPGISDEAGSFGGSGLANTGEDMLLQNASGEIIDTLSFASGWPAGNAETKETMQFSEGSWKTAAPTPGSENAAAHENDASSENDDAETIVTRSSSGSSKKKEETLVLKEPRVIISHPSYFVAGIPETMQATVEIPGGTTQVGYFIWSSGDGYAEESKELQPFLYSFKYPGKYTVTLAYFKNEKQEEPIATGQFTANVVLAGIELSQPDAQTVVLANKGKQTVELRNWKLASGNNSFVFPRYTLLNAGSTIHVPASRLGMHIFTAEPILMDSEGNMAAVVKPKTVVSSAVKRVETSANRPAVLSVESAAEPAPELSALAVLEEDAAKKSQSFWLYLGFGALILAAFGLFLLLEKINPRRNQ